MPEVCPEVGGGGGMLKFRFDRRYIVTEQLVYV